MRKFTIPCSWEVCGELEIEADTLEDAISAAHYLGLPKESEVILDSFDINFNDCLHANRLDEGDCPAGPSFTTE